MLASTCFLLTLLTSSASGSPGKHDLYDVGGYCITTLVCTLVLVLHCLSSWMYDCLCGSFIVQAVNDQRWTAFYII